MSDYGSRAAAAMYFVGAVLVVPLPTVLVASAPGGAQSAPGSVHAIVVPAGGGLATGTEMSTSGPDDTPWG